jgi:uncharacterized DUF497 family protein
MGKTVISPDGRFELYDDTHSTLEETRYIGLAELQNFIILYLSYIESENGRTAKIPLRTRIISVRPAEPIEERMYYEWRKNFTI